MCAIMDVGFAEGGARVDSTLFQIVCEPRSFTFRIKTLVRRDRWVDIPLAQLLFSRPR
jgi:hypothetical protein